MYHKEMIGTPCNTDFYKVTMAAAIFRHFPEASAEYKFVCRTKGVDLRGMVDDIREEIYRCETLGYDQTEIGYLRKFSYLKREFLCFLDTRQVSGNDVTIKVLDSCENGGLDIRIRGPWLYTIDWEIWILKIISELYMKKVISESGGDLATHIQIGRDRLKAKLDFLKENAPGLKFVDMGTRRAASSLWHQYVLQHIIEEYPNCLAGTSNIYFAHLLNIPCFGTHAHEWDSAHLAFYHPLDAKKMAMQNWLDTFDGACGVCLTDTFTTDVFLRSFNKMYANAFTGVRHDSGPWDVWAKKILGHYRKLGIDPKTKTLVFSDSLNFQKMVVIYNALKDECRVGFGIGTNLCNDLGFEPLNIVIKLVGCNGRPVLKISDVPTKATYDDEVFYRYICHVFGVPAS